MWQTRLEKLDEFIELKSNHIRELMNGYISLLLKVFV